MNKIDEYSSAFQTLLQSRIVIKCGKKTVKTGVLKLFNIKQYFIKLYIETENKEQAVLEVPYPFAVEETDTGCVLNYKLSAMCNNHKKTMEALTSYPPKAANKMYDNFLIINSCN
jgi:hypothetical protein